jgi:hypothetical protein
MQSNYTRLHRSVMERRAENRKHQRERAGELFFHVFLFGALCWYAFGGAVLLQQSANAPGFYNGPVYIGMGAFTYITGWWIRFWLTGWRGLL